MANLNVTYDDMTSAATRLTNGQNDIINKLTELKSLISGLVSGGYVTEKSSVAFNNAYEEFDKGATQTINGLEGMSAFLKAAAQALGDTDQQLASALNR